MSERKFILRNDGAYGPTGTLIAGCIRSIIDSGMAAMVTVKEMKPQRNLEQNKRFWATLGDLSDQVNWYGNKLSAEDWKHVLTAGLKKQRAVPGIDGGFVVLGTSTSRMSVGEMSELIELAIAFGTEQGVKWTDPKERDNDVSKVGKERANQPQDQAARRGGI